MTRRVLIINTGGTIGMISSPDGYRPSPGYLQQQLDQIPELKHGSMPSYEFHEYQPQLDSSNLTPSNWLEIANDIERRYDEFDGFLVLHGTDTMAFTSSALALMLGGLDKPVVLTGSQLPLCEIRNDARENLITGLLFAARDDIPEVCLYFGNKLLRGCRATKISTSRFDSFDSPNYGPLASAGTSLKIDSEKIRGAGDGKLRVRRIKECNLATFRLYPGLSAEVLEHVLQDPIQGLILETYGSGNGPSNNDAVMNVFRTACQRGVVIVNCSQCPHGSVAMNEYATGKAINECGVISGGDMTIEATLTKLAFLFSQHSSVDDIRRLMQVDCVGELSVS